MTLIGIVNIIFTSQLWYQFIRQTPRTPFMQKEAGLQCFSVHSNPHLSNHQSLDFSTLVLHSTWEAIRLPKSGVRQAQLRVLSLYLYSLLALRQQ